MRPSPGLEGGPHVLPLLNPLLPHLRRASSAAAAAWREEAAVRSRGGAEQTHRALQACGALLRQSRMQTRSAGGELDVGQRALTMSSALREGGGGGAKSASRRGLVPGASLTCAGRPKG